MSDSPTTEQVKPENSPVIAKVVDALEAITTDSKPDPKPEPKPDAKPKEPTTNGSPEKTSVGTAIAIPSKEPVQPKAIAEVGSPSFQVTQTSHSSFDSHRVAWLESTSSQTDSTTSSSSPSSPSSVVQQLPDSQPVQSPASVDSTFNPRAVAGKTPEQTQDTTPLSIALAVGGLILLLFIFASIYTYRRLRRGKRGKDLESLERSSVPKSYSSDEKKSTIKTMQSESLSAQPIVVAPSQQIMPIEQLMALPVPSEQTEHTIPEQTEQALPPVSKQDKQTEQEISGHNQESGESSRGSVDVLRFSTISDQLASGRKSIKFTSLLKTLMKRSTVQDSQDVSPTDTFGQRLSGSSI